MEESKEDARVSPELYFLIAKFLSGGPLKETAKTLLKELKSVEVLPRRLDWEGRDHEQSYDELESQYTEMPWQRLVEVCQRALTTLSKGSARLSLLSDRLIRAPPKYSAYTPDHCITRRLVHRELGMGPATSKQLVTPRLLSGLQLQRRTLGHLSAVYCLLFDCTGRYVITGADDLLVKVWSSRDGRLLGTLRGAGAEITDVCVTSDGALLAAGSVERVVRVWRLDSAAPVALLTQHTGTITAVHWAPTKDNEIRWLASTSTDGSVAFWTCSRSGQFLSQPVQYVERMRPGACHMICAAWSSGGAFLAAGSADHHVRLYLLEPGSSPRRILETAAHSDAVDSLSWSRRGRFVSGSKDGTAALWALHAAQWHHTVLRCQPIGDTSDNKRLKVTMVQWDVSDTYIVTAVSDCTIRVWCGWSCRPLRVLRGHSDEAYVLEAHPYLPAVFLSAGHDGRLFVWDASNGETIASFHNRIEGQGDGAIFDAKWNVDGCGAAASDSHGHLLLLGLGLGHRLYRQLPTELFFHTDYRPLVRDALGGALDEQTETPPHLMPPPFLVDVEGAPHPPSLQRLVPGRENLTLSQLIPMTGDGEAESSQLDLMIDALRRRFDDGDPVNGINPSADDEHRSVWRGSGVRRTLGSWQRGSPLHSTHEITPLVPPLPDSVRSEIEKKGSELYECELSWYRREMRRRPVMISTADRRRPGRPAPRARVRPTVTRIVTPREEPEEPELESSGSESSECSVRLSASASAQGSSASDDDSSHFGSKSDNSSSSKSTEYSDWEAGERLAPPARARRRHVQPARRYSPSVAASKRSERTTNNVAASTSTAAIAATVEQELPEEYRPGEWITSVTPRKAPYYPQMGDQCVYFRIGHQRYFEAVSEKDVYKVNPRDKPWERTEINDFERVKVIGIKYIIKPPRIACLKLARVGGRSFTVKYHDMPDVIDFILPEHLYRTGVGYRWSANDRFRCMIDDSWWLGTVLEAPSVGEGEEGDDASNFLSLRVRWDNGEVERLSPWDLEPMDPNRTPPEPGGCLPVLPTERETLQQHYETEWSGGTRRAAAVAIAAHIHQVMTLSVAEPFVAPVDLQLYPSYALVVAYPIDLSTIKARFENLFYRRPAAAQFDVRYLASNAEQFNKVHSPIVRQARLVTTLLLYIISNWQTVDVVQKYHELAATYQSSDEDVIPKPKQRTSRTAADGDVISKTSVWRGHCCRVLSALEASADASPFKAPVPVEEAPDYHTVITNPMDLSTVRRKLNDNEYTDQDQFAADVRLIFTNSRLYNTNKRSRIYSMTVRLSALFAALWSRVPLHSRRIPRHNTKYDTFHNGPSDSVRPSRETRRTIRRTRYTALSGTSGSESEPLAVTSRRARDPLAGVTSRRTRDPVSTMTSRRRDPTVSVATRERTESLDSDAPLHRHSLRKGKGVGKKSKNISIDEPSTSSQHLDDESPQRNGLHHSSDNNTSSSDSALSNLEVLEESLDDELNEPDYSERLSDHVSTSTRQSTRGYSRKRRRKVNSDSSGSVYTTRRRDAPRSQPKRRRSRVTDGSSSSSGSTEHGVEPARHYESDRSYRPRYSTDDDTPLQLYRQRQENNDENGAGPSTSRRKHKKGRVRLRTRKDPRRYNEDSEEDSIAVISKRLRAPPAARLAQLLAHRRGAQGPPPSSAHTNDHNYFNGHASQHNGESSRQSSEQPLSISSRGRVRKLTAKARGLLRE